VRNKIEVVAENLRRLRKYSSLTQKQLADMAQISLRQYQSIEQAKSDLKISTLEKLSLALKIDATDLLICWDKFNGGKNIKIEQRDFSLSPLDDLPVGIQVCDRDGLFLYANKAAQALMPVESHLTVTTFRG
jgi:transcriptional regulator with XRE-family HTH domain